MLGQRGRTEMRGIMRYLKYSALAGILLAVASVNAPAQVSIGVGIGPGYVAGPPVCAYGYYNYYPYACAPYGYYGSEWFVNGVFIGIGPWYHWGHPAWFWNRGWYGRPGWGYRGGYARGYARGYAGSGFHGGNAFHGEGVFRGGGGGFHG